MVPDAAKPSFSQAVAPPPFYGEADPIGKKIDQLQTQMINETIQRLFNTYGKDYFTMIQVSIRHHDGTTALALMQRFPVVLQDHGQEIINEAFSKNMPSVVLYCLEKNVHHVNPLHTAATYRAHAIAKQLLLNGYNVNDPHPIPPLFQAIEKNDVGFWIENGADVNFRDPLTGNTPLSCAAIQGSGEVLMVLLACGARVKREDGMHLSLGNRSLVRGSNCNETVMNYRILAQYGAATVEDFGGKDALYNLNLGLIEYVFVKGSLDDLQFMLEMGFNPNLIHEGSTALHQIDGSTCTDKIRLMVQYGADLNTRSIRDNTPLASAAQYGSPEVLKALLKRGAKVKREDGLHLCKDNRSLVDSSTCPGLVEKYRILSQYGATVEDFGGKDVFYSKDRGMIGCVFEKVSLDDLRFMLGMGFNPNLIYRGGTVLHRIHPKTDPQKISLLLEHGADPTLKNSEGQTAAECYEKKYVNWFKDSKDEAILRLLMRQ